MAEEKMTQAQKAQSARSTKKPASSVTSSGKSTGKSPRKPVQEPEQLEIQAPKSGMSRRIISGFIYMALFVLFLVIAMNQDGWFLLLVKNLFQGLFGNVAFYIAVPMFLFLVIIQFSNGREPVMLRSVCALVFVYLCGVISHLSVCRMDLGQNLEFFTNLYRGGIDGLTGGLLCGMVAEALRATFGIVLTFIVLIVGAVLCLLAAFRITIPSLIRAFQERPRFEDEEEEEERPMRPDPSSVIVNTAVNKHHELKQRRRERRLEAATEQAEHLEEEPELPPVRNSKAPSLPSAKPAKQKAFPVKFASPEKSRDIMSQIEDEIDTEVEDAPQPTVIPEEEDPFCPETVTEIIEVPIQVIPETGEVISGVAVEPCEVPARMISEPVKSAPVASEPAKAATPAPAPAAPVSSAAVAEPIPIVTEKKVTSKDAAAAAAEVASEIAMNSTEEKPVYHFPPIDLLRRPKGAGSDGSLEMKENTRRLNETLASFKIEAHISNVTRGPSVTRYEVELQKGVRLNKLTSCADDIALSLGASGVRIAPVPGKISVVGIEVPNQNVTTVTLREVIDSSEFTRARSKSSFSVGKDIGGSCIIGNIAKLPHMLIAGTTGSGKSVCMNSIIISLLYKASPEDVRLIMVDPKMVELGIYNGIPHLLIPVVTDPKKAAGSLQWAVSEMMRRYKAMSDAGVRDLESYNSMIDGQELEGERLPQVVVIIDELADLMLVAAKEVEESICRIAQMGRAAGIHLIIATQRPSADVITGLMKANIPSRIAFAVASAMESRIILDTQGAEKLVGKGDMLYAPIGCGKPMRVQGCFVSDAEVEAVATFVKENFSSSYDKSVMEEIEKTAAQTGTKGNAAPAEPETPDEPVMDEMLPAAADVVMETGQASVSMLQRRLKLGYARAARIMDLMEEFGIVGPYAGSKPRNILITRDQWEVMKSDLMNSGTAVPASQQTLIPEIAEPISVE